MNRRIQQKANTRAKIKQIAKQAFFENGVEITTTREISRLAGVAVGTFFVHFPDKLDLIKEIYFEAMDERLQGSLGMHAPTASPCEYLTQIAKTLFPFYGEYIEFTRQIMIESMMKGGVYQRQLEAVREGIVSRFLAVGVEMKTARIFADNMVANYWMVVLESLPENAFATNDILVRMENLNLPFKVSFENANRQVKA